MASTDLMPYLVTRYCWITSRSGLTWLDICKCIYFRLIFLPIMLLYKIWTMHFFFCSFCGLDLSVTFLHGSFWRCNLQEWWGAVFRHAGMQAFHARHFLILMNAHVQILKKISFITVKDMHRHWLPSLVGLVSRRSPIPNRLVSKQNWKLLVHNLSCPMYTTVYIT